MNRYHEKVADLLEACYIDLRDSEKDELANVMSGIRSNLEFLDLVQMEDTLSGHDFDFEEMKTNSEGMTVYLCLPPDLLPVCHKWFRICLNMALKAMQRVQKKPKHRVVFMNDEISQIGLSEQLLNSMSFIAGSHVQIVNIFQDINQLNIYGNRKSAFTGNAGVTLVWGLADNETEEYFEKKLGKCPVFGNRKNVSTNEAITGDHQGAEMQPLLSADEIRRYMARTQDRMLVLIPEFDPIVMPRVKYFDQQSEHYNKLFRGRYEDFEKYKENLD